MMKFSPATAVQAALFVAGARQAVGGPPNCGSNYPTSCQNTSAITNTCCTEVHGQILQVQIWDSNPATGPADSWTIHGLWPDNCDGSYPQYCDSSRDYTNISCILEAGGAKGQDTLDFMETYWKNDNGDDEEFWEHEWEKHGTCYSTLQPSCYSDYFPQEEVIDFFNVTTTLFQSLPTYQWLADAGITPDANNQYASSDVLAALQQPRGVNAIISCTDGALSQVQYTFNVQGSVDGGTFIPAEPNGESNDCPDNLYYNPKDLDTTPQVSATTCPSSMQTGS